MPVDADTFKRSLGSWPSGVTIVTSQHGAERLGMTVSAFTSVSLDPPLDPGLRRQGLEHEQADPTLARPSP